MRIKVCGLTRAPDMRCCERLGVDWIGFIFHPASPRGMHPIQAAALTSTGVQRVGVFVHQSLADIVSIIDTARLDLVQLHGDYSPQDCRQITTAQVIKVFWPERHAGRKDFQDALKAYQSVCDYFLLDAGTSGGGHGKALDIPWLPRLQSPRPWMLAGGLNPTNLNSCLTRLDPWGVDLNSGVEQAPGIKDHAQLAAAVEIVRRPKAITP